MPEYGYALSSEEHTPNDLVHFAVRAEEMGFNFALISDHYHPWVSDQGHSPFVWSVIGGIAVMTRRLRLGTGVTCPIMRIHPAILAQAAATSAAMIPGRFFFGVGTGEMLNEHILGDHWPMVSNRQKMLSEAISIIRELWKGEEVNHWGEYYTIENAQIFTLPNELPPIYIAASGPESASLAGEIGDGYISTTANENIVQQFEKNGGGNKPKIGQVTVCWAEAEQKALETVTSIWPISGLPGTLHADLPTPAHFEDAARLVKEDDLRKEIVLGPDPQRHLDMINKMVESGCDHVYLHQIGPDQEGFFKFYQQEIMPHLR